MPSVEVRMAIWGRQVDRLDTDQVVEIVASRLRRATGKTLALGWTDFDHPNRVGANDLDWLLLAEGMPNTWRSQLLTAEEWPRVTAAELLAEGVAASREVRVSSGISRRHRGETSTARSTVGQ